MATGARIIWILFGSIEGLEPEVVKLREAYEGHRTRARSRGYSLGMPEGETSKGALLRHLADSATVAVAWHSHGVYNGFGEPTGQLVASGKVPVSASDLRGLSPNLQYAALLGCGLTVNKKRWLRALNFERFDDGTRRLSGSGDKTAMWEFGSGGRRFDAYPKRFATREGSNPHHGYSFTEWLDQLPKIDD